MKDMKPTFYRFLISKAFAGFVFNTFSVFYLWYLVQKYHSVFLAGMLATIYLAAMLISSIPFGHLIDRSNSTHLGFVASIFVLIGAVSLFFGNSIASIYVAAVLLSLGIVFKGDSFSATMKRHLEERQFLAGNSINQSVNFSYTLAGTVFGGIAILYLSHSLDYVMMAIALASLIVAFPAKEALPESGGRSVRSEMGSIFRFLKRITGFLVVGFVLNGIFESLEVYSSGLFHIILKASPVYYTAFLVSISVGAIAGAALAGKMKDIADRPNIFALMILCYSPLLLLLSLSRMASLDVADALVIGIMMSLINVPLQAKLMKVVPAHIYGKTMAFLRVFLSGAQPAMAAVLSFAALYFPVNTILLYLSVISFPVALLSFVVLPRFFSLSSKETATLS